LSFHNLITILLSIAVRVCKVGAWPLPSSCGPGQKCYANLHHPHTRV